MRIIAKEVKDYIQQRIDEYAANIDKGIFLQVKDILNKYFGEDNNQIVKPSIDDAERWLRENAPDMSVERLKTLDQVESTKPFAVDLWGHLKVYIRFEELVITNGRSNKGHKIKDLWVRFDISGTGAVSHLRGTRSTLSFAEARSQYFHSHLGGRQVTDPVKPPRFEPFCLGSGEINQVIMFLGSQFDAINFTLFCLHLKNYVVWESIEGRPHMRYEEINNSRPNSESRFSTPSSIGTSETNKVVRLIKECLTSISPDVLRKVIDPCIINDEVTNITRTEELEMFLAQVILGFEPASQRQLSNNNINCYLAKKDADGRYIHPEERNNVTDVREPSKPIFEFKGQLIFLKVEGLRELLDNNNTNNANKNNNVYANPSITTEFIKSFSADFSEVCYRHQKVIRDNSLKNLLQTTGSDLLVMR